MTYYYICLNQRINWGSDWDCELYLLCQPRTNSYSVLGALCSSIQTHSNAHPCDEIWYFFLATKMQCKGTRKARATRHAKLTSENYRDRKFDLCKWITSRKMKDGKLHRKRYEFGTEFFAFGLDFFRIESRIYHCQPVWIYNGWGWHCCLIRTCINICDGKVCVYHTKSMVVDISQILMNMKNDCEKNCK